MDSTLPPGSASEVPWPTHETRVRVPDTSMLPGSEKAPPAAVGLLKQAVHGAHDTVDRLADRAAPAVRQLGEGLAAAEVALHAKTDQLRETGDAWAESARSTVRAKPLACVTGAFVLGVVLARLTR